MPTIKEVYLHTLAAAKFASMILLNFALLEMNLVMQQMQNLL